MNREIAIPGVEPCRLAKLTHGLQAEKRIAFDAPATLAAEQTGENVGDGIDIRGDVKSPPQQIVTGIDHHRDFFRRDNLTQTIDELRSTRPPGEHTNHAALIAPARLSPWR